MVGAPKIHPRVPAELVANSGSRYLTGGFPLGDGQ